MQEGGTPAYSISKAALNVLTRRLAAELQGTGILVNSIDPGWLATDMGGPGGGPVEEGVRGTSMPMVGLCLGKGGYNIYQSCCLYVCPYVCSLIKNFS
jgi:NAD(P)-dependent dehydrogenase (short-subunit alcohol dehydrogenase family)